MCFLTHTWDLWTNPKETEIFTIRYRLSAGYACTDIRVTQTRTCTLCHKTKLREIDRFEKRRSIISTRESAF